MLRLSFIIVLTSLASNACAPASNEPVSASVEDTTQIEKAANFAYPIGSSEYSTETKDAKDDWYNAQDLGENNHLGEDWNKNTGGNTDCGEPVYAIANGLITYAGDAGPGWGNVVIVTHTLPDGKKLQSLYGHLQEIKKTSGAVQKREQIGSVGNANGTYLCHLHLELRNQTSRDWDKVGGGYSEDRSGWLDPSEFIDSRR